jgi:arylformamidase
LIKTAGLRELPELVRQSKEYAAALLGRGLRGQYFPLKKHDHFSILEEPGRPDGAVVSMLKEWAWR